MSIRAGRLNQRVKVFLLDNVKDDFGETTEAKTEIKTVWSEVIPNTSGTSTETFTQSQDRIKVTMRYIKAIYALKKELMLLEHKGIEYEVESKINYRMANELIVIEALARG